jgi:hypothetical protein
MGASSRILAASLFACLAWLGWLAWLACLAPGCGLDASGTGAESTPPAPTSSPAPPSLVAPVPALPGDAGSSLATSDAGTAEKVDAAGPSAPTNGVAGSVAVDAGGSDAGPDTGTGGGDHGDEKEGGN